MSWSQYSLDRWSSKPQDRRELMKAEKSSPRAEEEAPTSIKDSPPGNTIRMSVSHTLPYEPRTFKTRQNLRQTRSMWPTTIGSNLRQWPSHYLCSRIWAPLPCSVGHRKGLSKGMDCHTEGLGPLLPPQMLCSRRAVWRDNPLGRTEGLVTIGLVTNEPKTKVHYSLLTHILAI